MRSRSFKTGRFWGWIAACCLSVSPALAQSELASSVPASSLKDSLYHDGLGALEREDWPRAVLSFENLQTLQPDYLDVRDQRALAWKKLKEARAAENAGLYGGRNKIIFRLGLASVALLAICGIVVAWPHTQVCYRLWRGDDHGAAQVYEKILQRHPRRTKFYAPLAELYLFLGRKDDRAIKVYKAALHLNPAAPNRKELNRMVAQKYLTGNFTDDDVMRDDDAIPVLEEALNAVYNTRPQSLPVPQRAGRQLVPRYA